MVLKCLLILVFNQIIRIHHLGFVKENFENSYSNLE